MIHCIFKNACPPKESMTNGSKNIQYIPPQEKNTVISTCTQRILRLVLPTSSCASQPMQCTASDDILAFTKSANTYAKYFKGGKSPDRTSKQVLFSSEVDVLTRKIRSHQVLGLSTLYISRAVCDGRSLQNNGVRS